MTMKAADDLNEITEVEEPIDGKTIVETYYGEDEEETENLPAEQSSEQEEDDGEFNEDVDTARDNLREIIETGGDALKEMQAIGRSTDHPRAYEVLSTMMRTLVDANKAMVDISEKKQSKKKAKKEDEGDDGSGNVTNNTVFVGNPQDALDMIRRNQKK